MKPRIHLWPSDKKIVQDIQRVVKCTDITATILANRGLTKGPELQSFLNATLADMADPATLADMDIAADRLAAAVVKKQKILVFGDYDADGITAAAILVNFLRAAGAEVTCHIPHRIMEGYGLKAEQINRLAAAADVNLVVTVDCGAGSHEAARACQEAGLDLIITDHHQMTPPYPEALAIVNPARPDCASGLSVLCGAGVAFYLLIALRARLREQGFWNTGRPEPNLKQYCDLVAIGTIADVVPLTGINRILVKAGLQVMNESGRPGLQALLAAAKIKNGLVTAEDIAFRIAPRLNAAGRIDHGRTALTLLTSDDPETVQKTAAQLCRLNTKRQYLEEEITAEIFQVLRDQPEFLADRKMLVLAHHQWHQGVIGIAAAKTVRKHCLPVALISIQGEMGIGSARSVPGLDLYQVLCDCADLLEDFGGHALAAGFKIRTENIARFEKQLGYAVGRYSRDADFSPKIPVDCELTFDAISDHLLDELDQLQPFGADNPEPFFLASNVCVASSFLIKGKYPRMVLTQPAAPGRKIDAISFTLPAGREASGHFKHILFRLQRETWNGSGAPRLIIEAVSDEPLPIHQGDPHAPV